MFFQKITQYFDTKSLNFPSLFGVPHLPWFCATEKWYSGDVHLRYKVCENPCYHLSEQLICHTAHYSSLGAEGVVGTAELGIK